MMRSVPLHQRQKRRVKAVGFLELVCVLAKEQNTLVNQFADN